MHQRVVGPHRRGPGPHFVIEIRRRRGVRRIRRSRACGSSSRSRPGRSCPACLRLIDLVARLDQVRRAAALRADLHHAVVLARRGQHRLAFDDIDADRLLHIDIDARSSRPRSSAARASDRAWRSARCRDPFRAASRDSRGRCAASSSTPAARRPARPRPRACSDRRRTARPPRPARPGSGGSRSDFCRTSRSRSARRAWALVGKRRGEGRPRGQAEAAAPLVWRNWRRFMASLYAERAVGRKSRRREIAWTLTHPDANRLKSLRRPLAEYVNEYVWANLTDFRTEIRHVQSAPPFDVPGRWLARWCGPAPASAARRRPPQRRRRASRSTSTAPSARWTRTCSATSPSISGRMIYGGIYEEGSPLADADGYRKDVMDAVKPLGVSLLRWPGGNFASGYNWTDGIGPKDQRPARPELAWNDLESNRFGTDEFLRYAERIGAEPYICLNLGLGTVDDARHWVEYTNEAQAHLLGRPAPQERPRRAVRREILGTGQRDRRALAAWDTRARRNTPSSRSKTAKAVRAVDRSVKLIASGSSNYGPARLDRLEPHRADDAARTRSITSRCTPTSAIRTTISNGSSAARSRSSSYIDVTVGPDPSGAVRPAESAADLHCLRRVERLVSRAQRREARGDLQLRGRAGDGDVLQCVLPPRRHRQDGQPGADGQRHRARS